MEHEAIKDVTRYVIGSVKRKTKMKKEHGFNFVSLLNSADPAKECQCWEGIILRVPCEYTCLPFTA